jgi:cytochrome c-type biogenesis protein CcmE
MGFLDRIFGRLTESDESRLAEETRSWACTVPGAVPIDEAPTRRRVRVAGVVRRITVFPMEGNESLEAVVSDGTGEVSVVFMGRRVMPGLNLGTRVVVDGVLGEQRDGTVRMVNPKFEFSG